MKKHRGGGFTEDRTFFKNLNSTAKPEKLVLDRNLIRSAIKGTNRADLAKIKIRRMKRKDTCNRLEDLYSSSDDGGPEVESGHQIVEPTLTNMRSTPAYTIDTEKK